MLKILGIALRGTESGLKRIRDLVKDEIEFIYLDDFHKHHFEDGRIASHEPFDGILSQCITHCPQPYRDRTVLFSLGSCNRKIINKANIRQLLLDVPLRDIWVNNNTVHKALKQVGVDSKVMYRANDIAIPERCPPKPKNKFIIWYASPWNGCLQEHKKLAQDVISGLKDTGIKVFMLPHQSGWSRESHVCALGKIDLAEFLPCVHGMVRFGVLGDFGRINYDLVGMGKWTLNYDVDEPFMESVSPGDSVEDIVAQIVNLVENEPEENRVDRWMYAQKYLSPEAMKKKWIESLYYAYYGH